MNIMQGKIWRLGEWRGRLKGVHKGGGSGMAAGWIENGTESVQVEEVEFGRGRRCRI